MSDRLRITLPEQLVVLRAEDIAVSIASSSNEEQAEFFNRFAKYVNENYVSGCIDMQMAYIVDDLTPEARAMLMTMGEYSKDFR